jgi:hypothetical protein
MLAVLPRRSAFERLAVPAIALDLMAGGLAASASALGLVVTMGLGLVVTMGLGLVVTMGLVVTVAVLLRPSLLPSLLVATVYLQAGGFGGATISRLIAPLAVLRLGVSNEVGRFSRRP